jgi:two-component system, OmpR family, KDP operon response regulator KdpE
MTPPGDRGAKILVVDDEPEIRKLLRVALGAHGFEMLEAAGGREGIEKVALEMPDVVILDLGLPDIDGYQVVEAVREWSMVPIIILSVREQESDKIRALDAGANDYVTKPFNMGELMARIRVAIRHLVAGQSTPIVETGDLRMDLSSRQVTVRGHEVKLTPTEYELLKQLAIDSGKVLTRTQLLERVWGHDSTGDTQYLRVYIGQLRKKIEPDPSQPRYIITEPGVGYRLAVHDENEG